jgi:preprotein translocase subunit YajC
MDELLPGAPGSAPGEGEEAPAPREDEINAAELREEGEEAEEGAAGEEGPPPAKGRREGGFMGLLIPLAIIFAIMYLLLIRPQKKKEHQRQDMVDRLKKDDKVVTIGGIIGVVSSLTDREIILRLEDNTKMRVTRNAISRVIDTDQPE